MDLECMNPYLEITEQPSPYCWFERPDESFKDTLVGENSTLSVATYPKIRVVNAGRYNARVLMSCICDKRPFPIHPNSVVLRETPAPLMTKAEQFYPGVCMVILTPDNPEQEITNIGIEASDQKDIVYRLSLKIKHGFDPFQVGFSNNYRNYDLSVVRIVFDTFLEDPAHPEVHYRLAPIISTEIYDARLLTSSVIQPDLQICLMSHEGGSVVGEQIIILTGMINPHDVLVRFFELNYRNEIIWEDTGLIIHIYNECAIVLKTPKYHDINIQKPVNIYLQLIQPSTKNSTQPRRFTLYPMKPQAVSNEKNSLPFKKKYLKDIKEQCVYD